MRTFFYYAGVTTMVAAFPFWFGAVVADNPTAGAVGMLTFILGVLLTAVGAAMDYRANQYQDAVVEHVGQDGAPAQQDWPRP